VIGDRLVSLSDPDARPIRRSKPGRPTEFGYTVLVAECERGFIATHQTYKGNPPDAAQLVEAVTDVIALTGRPPGTVVGDRGFALRPTRPPWPGLGRPGWAGPHRHPSKVHLPWERTRRFKRKRSWRVGIEARISQLKRSFGLRRTRLRRLGGTRTWVGLGIFTYNLQHMTVVAR
jgi:IS5 family transposase